TPSRATPSRATPSRFGRCRDDVVVGQNKAVGRQDDAGALFGLATQIGLQHDDTGHHLRSDLFDAAGRHVRGRDAGSGPSDYPVPVATRGVRAQLDDRCRGAADTGRHHRDGQRTYRQDARAGPFLAYRPERGRHRREHPPYRPRPCPTGWYGPAPSPPGYRTRPGTGERLVGLTELRRLRRLRRLRLMRRLIAPVELLVVRLLVPRDVGGGRRLIRRGPVS